MVEPAKTPRPVGMMPSYVGAVLKGLQEDSGPTNYMSTLPKPYIFTSAQKKYRVYLFFLENGGLLSPYSRLII